MSELRVYFDEAVRRFNAYFGVNLPVELVEDRSSPDYDDAYTLSDTAGKMCGVVIGAGMCVGRNPAANLVAILAHEYGHAVMHHYIRNITPEEAEFEADMIAVETLYDNDCDPLSLCDALADIAHNHGYTIHNDNIGGHPCSAERIRRMKWYVRSL